MKKIFVFICVMSLFSAALSAQAKKNLTAKKSSVKAGKKVVKEEPVIVYNEDYEKGEELFGLNKPEEAIPFFEKCIDVKDVNPNVWIHLGVAYYQIGDYNRSLACCTKGLTKENTDHKILAYNAGNSAYAMTNYARADACYAIAMKEDESFAPAYLNRANAKLKQDYLQDAKENYIKYLELEPGSSQKPEIERLIALLDAEIIRRAKEKPELIDLDFANVKNEELIAIDDTEKVSIDLPEEKVVLDENSEELVRYEIAQAPKLPGVPERKEIVIEKPEAPSKIEEDITPLDRVIVAETVEKIPVDSEDANAPELYGVKPIKESVQEEPAPKEVFSTEILADALLSLPAGEVGIVSTTFGFSPNSPNPKLKKEIFNLTATDLNSISSYSIEIVDENGITVKTLNGKKLPKLVEWDGRTESNDIASGRYLPRLTVRYKNGGVVSADGNAFNCFGSMPQVYITPESDSFSPDDDGVDDVLKLSVAAKSEALVEGWKFEVKKNSKVIYSKEGKGDVPSNFEWDGVTSSGSKVKKGDNLSYKVSLTDSYGVGIQEDGSVEVTQSKKDPVVAKNVEISENPDGTLNIAIPTLSFKINSSELITTKQNTETIQKVYDILINEKYEDYKVTITGYVNPDGTEWTEEEQLLALNRARSVENKLKTLGIPENRLKSLCGTGKTPNKEYNRRVEFKLKK